jgi:chemotaxis protein histidine kinase CheA
MCTRCGSPTIPHFISSMSSSFSFRQRTGNIDWRAVTSVKVEDVILKGNPGPLQQVLDAVTFAEFRPDDVKNNSIESVYKLVNILQLIVEYLLHCQEAQFKVMRGMEGKIAVGKDQMSKMKKEVLSLKEDRKIYQRQLAMLRKSLGPDYFVGNQLPQGLPPPKVSSLLNPVVMESKQAGSALDAEVVKSVFKHEEDTRTFMATLLNDQRSAFVEQISMVTQALQRTQDLHEKENRSTVDIHTLWATQQTQVESTVQRAVEAMQRTVSQALTSLAEEQRQATTAALEAASTAAQVAQQTAAAAKASASAQAQQHTRAHEAEFTEIALQTAALEQFEAELNRRQAALERKEREISDNAVAARQSLEMSIAARRASDTERHDLLTANVALTMSALNVGARAICNTVKHGKRTVWWLLVRTAICYCAVFVSVTGG